MAIRSEIKVTPKRATRRSLQKNNSGSAGGRKKDLSDFRSIDKLRNPTRHMKRPTRWDWRSRSATQLSYRAAWRGLTRACAIIGSWLPLLGSLRLGTARGQVLLLRLSLGKSCHVFPFGFSPHG